MRESANEGVEGFRENTCSVPVRDDGAERGDHRVRVSEKVLDVEEDGRDRRRRRDARGAQRGKTVVDQEAQAGAVRLLGLEQLARHTAALPLGSTRLGGAAAWAGHVRVVEERLGVARVRKADLALHTLVLSSSTETVRHSSHLLFLH